VLDDDASSAPALQAIIDDAPLRVVVQIVGSDGADVAELVDGTP